MHPKTMERNKKEASRNENIYNPILRTVWSGTTIQKYKQVKHISACHPIKAMPSR